MLKIGCDPEFFLRDKITKDFISAYGKFPGTKKEPFIINKGAIQVDGMALEVNIEPATTADEFVENLDIVLDQARNMVQEATSDGCEIAFEPIARFDPDYFSICEFESKILGCDPDYDEFGNQKVPPEGMQDLPFRTAAGHLHIGWTDSRNPFEKEHFENCKLIARTFKTIKGFYPVDAAETERARFYGTPSSFRPRPYGIELRSPSNRWVERKETRRGMFITAYETMMKLGEQHAL